MLHTLTKEYWNSDKKTIAEYIKTKPLKLRNKALEI